MAKRNGRKKTQKGEKSRAAETQEELPKDGPLWCIQSQGKVETETEEEAGRNTDVLRGTEINKRWRETDRIERQLR